jgi:hypothetical protein
MIFNIVGAGILRVTLAMPVIVNYQVSGEPHQPVRQIALLGVVLLKRSVNSDKNFLGQIFRRFDARCKSKGEIENSPRKLRDDFLPSRTVARATTPHQSAPLPVTAIAFNASNALFSVNPLALL